MLFFVKTAVIASEAKQSSGGTLVALATWIHIIRVINKTGDKSINATMKVFE